jgi:RNA polymerase sigma factor (sigma-70 family)
MCVCIAGTFALLNASSMKTITIDHLIKGCKENNRKSQELLYKQLSAAMFTVCRRYTKNKTDAEDILQEGFIKVFTKINLYTGEGSFEGWVQRIMINTALSAYRSSQCRIKTTDIEAGEYDMFDSAYETTEDTDKLLNSLNKLPENYRAAFNLFAIEGYSHQEIAGKTGITTLQSRVHVCRARTMLRKSLVKLQPVSRKKQLTLSV